MTSELPVIVPDWPVPSWVHAACTTRMGGVSQAPWQSLNLGTHVGDHPMMLRKIGPCLGSGLSPAPSRSVGLTRFMVLTLLSCRSRVRSPRMPV